VPRLQGNSVVLAVLRSRVHWLLSRIVVELRYTGRRSGRPYTLPVQYARAGERLLVVPQNAASTWWRNFSTAQPVRVRLGGRLRDATARVVSTDDPDWAAHRRRYEQRWRRLTGTVSGPIVEITVHSGQ
jgi:deazaflavin-dependent oxidoreductase (nitroreductase family)